MAPVSAQAAVETALIEALGAHAGLSGAINGIHRMRPMRATPPYAVLGESLATDWSWKDARGREVRIALTIIDAVDDVMRLHRLMADAEGVIEALPRDLPGWRVASIAFLRSRVLRDAARNWAGLLEYRVRVMAAGGQDL